MNISRIIDTHPDASVALISHGRETTYGQLRSQVGAMRAELVHRAAVRALVGGLSAPPLASSTHGPDYLDAARRFTLGTPPSLTITHGLSGSGKSHASQRLLQASGAIRLVGPPWISARSPVAFAL